MLLHIFLNIPLFYRYDTSENALSLTYEDAKGQVRERDIAIYDKHPSERMDDKLPLLGNWQ